ncbi:HD-GYP domain-containing protein [Roseisolibacter sp. H3M3-2]|uniref:HD-GYP domain-containing protein n=1 Tax=Roseisolibacter sp. H3M3-2 TaxID=3031323 RepID=UPI0023D98241|nr:HD-GYP domain-containing protein [Roseisolibacter sp. H3M3-2]MDF1504826.1 HD domain-containing protein [Roseisolibacter sp. H3M3-2]
MRPTRPTPVTPATARPAPAAGAVQLSLSEVLTALSHALDLTEGQPLGHTVRTCLIGMRLAEERGLPAAERSALYYALLLKDAGCSSNAARMTALFGADDRAIKPRMKLVDWHRRLGLAVETWRCTAPAGSFRDRLRHFAEIARTPDVTRDLIQVRCDRGAEIARRLGFPDATADAVRALDEHWNGGGYPDGLRGDAIPLGARIANLAQTLETVARTHSPADALRLARRRRGTWFDPALVDHVQRWRRDRVWWRAVATPDAEFAASTLEPVDQRRTVDDVGLDEVARAFAEIIDAKSPYTYRHSANVATFAERIAGACGMDAAARKRVWRAGMLHDVGKLGVSNAILDKPARLTDEERAAVAQHPRFTWDILTRVRAFADFARPAALHHEKLDGSGYPWGLDGDALDDSARVLVVADIYEALTADRPYRAGMDAGQALAIMDVDRGTKLCPRALDALEAVVHSGLGVAEAA